MNRGFGQFCPVALASETLTQKWMLLIVRELCAGAGRFSDIRRGVPRISATLLKQRLDTLEHAGIVERRRVEGAEALAYALTAAGEELRPVLAGIGEWGQRWARDIRQDDLDPSWLVWAMHRRLDATAMPSRRTVIAIVFTDAPANQRRYWFVAQNRSVEVCVKPPGFEADLTVRVGLRAMAEIWRGLRPIAEEIKAGRMQLDGPPALRRAFPGWLLLSVYAPIKQKR